MRNLYLAIALSVLPLATRTATASQVFTPAWDKFHIEAGSIEIWGTQNLKGISSLKISIFKRTYVLNKVQLKELEGFSANGLEIGGETGWTGLGGETYMICFKPIGEEKPSNVVVVVIEEENGLKIQKGQQP